MMRYGTTGLADSVSAIPLHMVLSPPASLTPWVRAPTVRSGEAQSLVSGVGHGEGWAAVPPVKMKVS